MRPILRLLCLFVATFGTFGVDAENFEDLGQNLIRMRWREIQSDSQAQSFRQTHQMIDIAEDSWLQVLEAKSDFLSHPSQDVFVAQYQTQSKIRSHPFQFQNWIQSGIHLANLMIDRPWDGWTIIINLLTQWMIPVGFALSLVLFFHLWIWCRSLITDAPRWTFLRSRTSVLIALTALIMTTWISGNALWGIHLLLCLSIPYSRKPTFSAMGAGITAILLSFAPFGDVFNETHQMGVLNEALNLGRTRIEFSPTALTELTPIQKAIWSSHNQDSLAAQYWLEKSPVGLERSALELELKATDLSTTELTRSFEVLADKYPKQPMIQFNLAQLYTRGQELVKADHIRGQIDPNLYRQLTDWSSRTNRLLVGPQNDPMKSHLSDFFKIKFSKKLSELGLFPFRWPGGILYLIGFLLPWFFFVGGFFHRQYASGVCSHTGETSPSPIHEVSAIYQSALQQKDPAAQGFRNQVEQSARSYTLLKMKRARFWCLWLGGAYELNYDDAILVPVLKTALLYSSLWFSFSLSRRFSIANFLKIPLEPGFAPQTFFTLLFIAAILLWAGLIWDRHRKAQR